MTKKVNGDLIIENTGKSVCEMCGKVAELRPYGPNGENICFPCGMKDEETTARQFLEVVTGPDDLCH